MDLSIIIVNWNTRELLRDCLTSLEQATTTLQSEVFVVDNASSDGSAGMVRQEFPHYHLLESGANLGFSRGNNLALPLAKGRAVLLLNPDTVCPPGSLTKLYTCLQDTPDAGIVGPTLVDDQFHPVLSYGNFPASRYHWLGCLDPQRKWLPLPLHSSTFAQIPEAGRPSGPVDYVVGACLLIRSEALAEVGPLDERFFMYFEETDWCWRVWRHGYKVYYCADVSVIHLEGRAARQVSEFSLIQFQRSYREFITKNYGAHRVWAFRAAQFCEYSLKGLARSMWPTQRDKNRVLARSYFTIARLQLVQNIDSPTPG